MFFYQFHFLTLKHYDLLLLSPLNNVNPLLQLLFSLIFLQVHKNIYSFLLLHLNFQFRQFRSSPYNYLLDEFLYNHKISLFLQFLPCLHHANINLLIPHYFETHLKLNLLKVNFLYFFSIKILVFSVFYFQNIRYVI